MLVNIDIHHYEEAKSYLSFAPHKVLGRAEIKQKGLVIEVMQIKPSKPMEVCTMLLSKGIKLY